MKKITPLHLVLAILFLIGLALLNTMLHADDAPPPQQAAVEEKTPYVETDQQKKIPSDEAYTDKQIDHSERMGQILSSTASLNEQLMANPDLINDAGFISEVQSLNEEMKAINEEMKTFPKAPIKYEMSDGLYRQAVAAYTEGLDYYARGVSENDLNLISISIDRTTTGNDLLNEAIREVQEVQ